MSVPSIATLRAEASDIIAKCSRGQMDAIATGAMSAAATGSPIPSSLSAQALITICQPIIDQADSDAKAIYLRYLLKYLESPVVVTSIGTDGSNWVFKNGNGWLRDQNGDYHLEIGYLVEGQMQSGYEATGYTYANIP